MIKLEIMRWVAMVGGAAIGLVLGIVLMAIAVRGYEYRCGEGEVCVHTWGDITEENQLLGTDAPVIEVPSITTPYLQVSIDAEEHVVRVLSGGEWRCEYVASEDEL